MKFRTELEIDKFDFEINHYDNILTIGSCFAENIATYFNNNRFNVLGNPFGVLYNPISIYNSIKFVVEKKVFTTTDLIQHHGEWHSFYHHSDFSSNDIEQILERINTNIELTNKFLASANYVIITFGTSYVYRYLKNDLIVSNCHKIPQKEFEHFRLSTADVSSTISKTVEVIQKINPNAKFILSVSPVRHWKDGANNNQLSKANLLLGINEFLNNKSNCYYFPSYEIVMDDLRDYRFYKEDLVHPNKIATNYIWEKFSNSIFSDECLQTIKEVGKVSVAKKHKIRNENSIENQIFITNTIKKIENLKEKYKHLSFDDDLQYFKSKLI